jgi:PD-(D/E)XK nuclease superfamily
VLADEKVAVGGSPDDLERVEGVVLEVGEGILGQDFEPRPSPEICSWCDFRLICPASRHRVDGTKGRGLRALWMAALAGVASAVLLAEPSYAATFTVTNGNDTGTGSLRDAISQAESNNNDPIVDLVQFDSSVTTVNLDSPISLTHPVTITGPGADGLTVRRNPTTLSGQFRLFGIIPAAGNTVTIQNLTISGARADNSAGAGIIMSGLGTLILDSVVLKDNQALGATGQGGAIYYDRGFTSIRNSTLSDNQATAGGAIRGSSNGADNGTGELINSTLAGNSATDFGGGVEIDQKARIVVNSSTVFGNTADSDNNASGTGGGFRNNSTGTAPVFSVANTVIAGNALGTSAPVANQCNGTYASSDYNLRSTDDAGCIGFTETHDLVDANPMLGTLGDNGGPTPTIALLTGSPAIDAGNPDSPLDGLFPTCPTTDQRGVSRLGPNRCDIGAFEKRSPTTTVLACSPNSLTLGSGSSTCTATVTDVAGLQSPSGDVSFKTDASGTFGSGPGCTLPTSVGASASCSVSYTPAAVGTGSHLIGAFYEGTPDLTPSDGSDELFVAAPPQPTPGTTGTAFDLKAAIKKCKKKFPKGPKRKKCIKRAKRRAQAT